MKEDNVFLFISILLSIDKKIKIKIKIMYTIFSFSIHHIISFNMMNKFLIS